MAEIVRVIVTKEGRGFACQMCGTAWIPRRKNPPRRCPNQECRSRRWDADKYPNAGPPRPPSPNGGGAYDNGVAADDALPRTCYRTLRTPAIIPTNSLLLGGENNFGVE